MVTLVAEPSIRSVVVAASAMVILFAEAFPSRSLIVQVCPSARSELGKFNWYAPPLVSTTITPWAAVKVRGWLFVSSSVRAFA